ncbi:MAG: FAD-dependent oxidoreductase, partial [Promethearchaeota archaeon]
MKVVIIGNNVAGTFTAQNLRSLNEYIEIEIFTQEQYPYYTRIKLPELIPKKVAIESLIVFKEDWYATKRINLHLNKKAVKIDPKNKTILFEKDGEPILYDKLILALGSTPNIPPIKNSREMKDKNKGVFTLRTINDALKIREYIEKFAVKKAIVIGGGLLGLELANQLKDSNLETTVVEFFPRLLPRQLDEECGTMLKNEIESRDI